jgi:hypothetical protein
MSRGVAEHLVELFRRRHFDRLILAGPEEATSELRRVLPRPLAQRLGAVVPAEVYADTEEILEKTLAVARGIEHEMEARLLKELVDARGWKRAVFG